MENHMTKAYLLALLFTLSLLAQATPKSDTLSADSIKTLLDISDSVIFTASKKWPYEKDVIIVYAQTADSFYVGKTKTLSNKLVVKKHIKALCEDWINQTFIRFDFAPYVINNNKNAFGIRVTRQLGGYPRVESKYELLSLYFNIQDSLTPIFSYPIQSSHYDYGLNESNSYKDSSIITIINITKENNYNNLILKTWHKSSNTQHGIDSGNEMHPNETASDSGTTTEVFHWQGRLGDCHGGCDEAVEYDLFVDVYYSAIDSSDGYPIAIDAIDNCEY